MKETQSIILDSPDKVILESAIRLVLVALINENEGIVADMEGIVHNVSKGIFGQPKLDSLSRDNETIIFHLNNCLVALDEKAESTGQILISPAIRP